jgi:hypothetical protein
VIKELLQEITSTAFGGWTPNDGCNDVEVAAVGDRLGISLPDAFPAPDDAGCPDPRVHGRSEPGGKRYSESRRLSSFLINVAGRQVVRSLPHQATCRIREQQLGVVESLLSYVGSREVQKGGEWSSFVDHSVSLLSPAPVAALWSRLLKTVRFSCIVPHEAPQIRNTQARRNVGVITYRDAR